MMVDEFVLMTNLVMFCLRSTLLWMISNVIHNLDLKQVTCMKHEPLSNVPHADYKSATNGEIPVSN